MAARPYHKNVEFDENTRWLDSRVHGHDSKWYQVTLALPIEGDGKFVLRWWWQWWAFFQSNADRRLSCSVQFRQTRRLDNVALVDYLETVRENPGEEYDVQFGVKAGLFDYDYARMASETALLRAELVRYVMHPSRVASVAALASLGC